MNSTTLSDQTKKIRNLEKKVKIYGTLAIISVVSFIGGMGCMFCSLDKYCRPRQNIAITGLAGVVFGALAGPFFLISHNEYSTELKGLKKKHKNLYS